MKYFFRYLYLECKRAVKVAGHMLVSIAVMIFLIVGILSGAAFLMRQNQILDPIRVGLVISGDQPDIKLAFKLIENTESIKKFCEFAALSEEDADRKIQAGEVEAVIIIEDEFYEKINRDINDPVKIVFKDQTSLNTITFREVLDAAVSIIDTMEASMYAIDEVSSQYPLRVEKWEMKYDIYTDSLETLMKRNSVFTSKPLSVMGQLSVPEYYFVFIIPIIFLFVGMNFGFLYKKQESIIEQRLVCFGVGQIQTGFVKILVMTGLLWGISAFLYSFMCIAGDFIFHISVQFSWGSLLGLVLISCCTACYYHLIYRVVNNTMHAGFVLLSLGIIMTILSGGIVPTAFLPDYCRYLSPYTFLSFQKEALSDLLFRQINRSLVLVQLGVSAGCFGVGEIILWNRRKHGMSS